MNAAVLPFHIRVQAATAAAFFVLAALLAACTPAPAVPGPAANPPIRPATAAPEPSPSPAVLPTFTPIPTAAAGSLFVDAAQDLGSIGPYVYGSNYGPWLFLTLEMRPQAVGAKISMLRYPGGNWGDLNDIDPWMLDQYIALCQELGSEPYINARLRGGTPEKAAALVSYVNKEKGYKVKYWGIGNEPSLYPEYDTVRYNEEWPKFAEAMRAADPTILLIGPETHQFTANPAANPKDSAGRDWLEEFLKANGDKVDIVAIHRYPFPTSRAGGAPSIADLRANSREWDEIIPALRQAVRKYTGRDLPVAVTEVNSSWASNSGGEATMDSLYNAIWWADSLGRMIRHKTEIVTQFALVGELGLMGKYKAYPMLGVYNLYQHFGTRLVYASSDQPDLSVFAAKTEAGELTLVMVNLGPEAASYPLTIQGFSPSGPAQAWRLDKDTPLTAEIEAQPLASGQMLSLPPQSVTLYRLPGQ